MTESQYLRMFVIRCISVSIHNKNKNKYKGFSLQNFHIQHLCFLSKIVSTAANRFSSKALPEAVIIVISVSFKARSAAPVVTFFLLREVKCLIFLVSVKVSQRRNMPCTQFHSHSQTLIQFLPTFFYSCLSFAFCYFFSCLPSISKFFSPPKICSMDVLSPCICSASLKIFLH